MDVIEAACATCDDVTEHEVLKQTEQNMTVRCSRCQTVANVTPRRLRVTQVKVVASDGPRSWHAVIDVPTEERIAEGYEFELEGHRMLVTGLETMTGQFPKKTRADKLKQVFAKVFDQVMLKISVNDKDVTRSYEQPMDPDDEVRIGQVLRVEEGLVAIKTMKSDQNRTIHTGFLLARNIRRVFCDQAPAGAVEGEMVNTRIRGAKARGEKGTPRRGPARGPGRGGPARKRPGGPRR